MPTLEEVAQQSLEQRLGVCPAPPRNLAAAIRGQSEAALVRRPDAANWAPTEILCHLQDIEVETAPANMALERAAGSPSLAAAHRRR